MADVPGKFFSATKVRTGVSPSSPGSLVGEPLPPVNPPGTSLNSVGLTMPSAFTVSNSPLTSNGTIGVAGAGTVGQYIRGDGSLADFPESSGGGSSVSYYLNGSVNQGTIGGVAYKELNKVPILGAGTDFTINANGYIASFLTDAGDPNLLEIPGGNWNFETYFSASSGGGSPTFYVELYKYDGSTFTLIASSSSVPELIAFGTTTTPYFSSLAVPTTVLALTDRLAVRYYVTHSGRTITLHTEDNHLCQIVTTFTTGITALNGLTAQVQNFAVGTSGTDFAISSATATHTFNLPTASATNRGALSSADWTTFNNKTSNLGTVTSVGLSSATSGVTIGSTPVTTSGTITLAIATASGSQNGLLSSTDWTTFNNKQDALINPVTGTGSAGQVAYWSSGSAITGESNLFWDATNDRLGIGTNFPAQKLTVMESTANSIAYFGMSPINLSSNNALITLQSGTIPQTGIDKTGEVGFIFQHSFGTGGVNGNANGGYLKSIRETVFGTASQVNTALVFATSTSNVDSEAMRIFSGSKVHIGTTPALNNGATLQVTGTAIISNSITADSFIKSGGTSSQFLKADGSVDSTTYVPTSRTITINGTSQDLSTDRTYNVGTVTSVAALTIGTTGTDLSSSVANGTTTPVITINVPTASATNRGALSAADWTTFNAKQNALTLTTTGSSGAATLVGSTLNIPNYSPDLSGYVPTSRTITINGTTQDLSANRTFNVGTVTSITATAGTGISISGSPITSSGTLTITNTAPDQIVSLTASTGISISGTYPNFTITNTSPSSGGTVTSVTASTPLFSSGGNTPNITIQQASGSQNGFLSSTDWTTFNNKAPSVAGGYLPLSGGTLTGHLNLKSDAGGVPLYIYGRNSDNSSNIFFYNETGVTLQNYISSSPTDFRIVSQQNAPISFVTNAASSTIADMTITANGNVGIGTSTPTSGAGWTPTLVLNATSAALVVKGINGQENSFGTSNGLYIDSLGNSTGTNNNIIFRTTNSNSDFSAVQRMVITSVGTMYVGASVDSAATSTFVSGFNGFGAKVSNNAFFLFTGLNSSDVRTFYVLGTGDVKNTNNSYGAISDIKIKENIEDATPKLDDLMRVKVRKYNLIGDNRKQIGVIAQELEEVFPAMVDELEDFEEVEVPQLDEKGNEILNEEGEVFTQKQRVSKGTSTKSVKYSVFVPMLIKAIQELKQEIEILKS